VHDDLELFKSRFMINKHTNITTWINNISNLLHFRIVINFIEKEI